MRSLEAGAVHLLALAAARLVLLVAMKPDRRQALKAGAAAPPRCGFGLDRLPPPRSGLSKQTRTDCGRAAPHHGTSTWRGREKGFLAG
jgi:hypothetical protein